MLFAHYNTTLNTTTTFTFLKPWALSLLWQLHSDFQNFEVEGGSVNFKVRVWGWKSKWGRTDYRMKREKYSLIVGIHSKWERCKLNLGNQFLYFTLFSSSWMQNPAWVADSFYSILFFSPSVIRYRIFLILRHSDPLLSHFLPQIT